MNNQRPFWKLLANFFIFSFLGLIALIIVVQTNLESFYHEEEVLGLENRSLVLSSLVEKIDWNNIGSENFKSLQTFSAINEIRITIIDQLGKVLFESHYDHKKMESHLNRPEIQEAIENNKRSVSKRYSSTIKKDLLYFVLPFKNTKQENMFLRLSRFQDDIDKKLWKVSQRILTFGFIIIILMSVGMVFTAKRVVVPLNILKELSEKFKDEEFDYHEIDHRKIEVKEIRDVMKSMRSIKKNMAYKIAKILKQKRERDAIFASLNDGIITVNKDGTIRHINSSACKIFALNESLNYRRKNFSEVIINESLQLKIKSALEKNQSITDEFVSLDSKNILYDISGLYSSEGEQLGILLTLKDITETRKLEGYRKEFVANVSHELRTPLTNIQGYVETMLEMDIQDSFHKKFLLIIDKNTKRLKTIIEDLLKLARLDQDSEVQSIKLLSGDINDVVKASVNQCNKLLKNQKIDISVKIPEIKSIALINKDLLEQAITNLIENAIKYSGEESKIIVEVQRIENKYKISVKDNGPGIKEEHHKRLFERFYSVDKARSRELGGSGLGLSIVKHIAMVHNGEVLVNSTLGEGSEFIIKIPSSS